MKLLESRIDLDKTKKIKNNNFKVDYRFKIIYSIAMMSVIASHLKGKGSIELNIQGWFDYTTFHMPLFMFSAGYFFKVNNINNTFAYIIRKFKRLILPIYEYNLFYGFIIQILKYFGFNKNKIKTFNLRIIFIEPLGGNGFPPIRASWFSSSLFFVEIYNIVKRKVFLLFKVEINESIYFLFDLFLSFYSVNCSNKGYYKIKLYMQILRSMHLNIYYELGIYYNKYLEFFLKNLQSELYFASIFSLKLFFHLYYSKTPTFFYGGSQFNNYPGFTVFIISSLGILFWVRISEILNPLLGKNFYVNIIADNTYSIMMNHFFAIFIVRTFFAIISKNTIYCKDFNFIDYYSMIDYIYIPNNILQAGILYFLSCFIIPIIMQKVINKIKCLFSKKNFF